MGAARVKCGQILHPAESQYWGLLWLSKEQEYQEEEAVGYQKLLEGTYKKLMLEGLLLVLLGSETSFLWKLNFLEGCLHRWCACEPCL